ncbi:hypothetical protein AAVH_06138 [Aphelenchoides avenae]|nr:hypothetical protein AAVH_06138 [Aphelenchus avenae]
MCGNNDDAPAVDEDFQCMIEKTGELKETHLYEDTEQQDDELQPGGYTDGGLHDPALPPSNRQIKSL